MSTWARATATERRHFLAAIRVGAGPAPVAPTISPSVLSIVDADSKLRPHVAARISTIMSRRGLKMGAVMTEMGMQPLNQSVSGAMARKPKRLLNPSVLAALEKWLKDNKNV